MAHSIFRGLLQGAGGGGGGGGGGFNADTTPPALGGGTGCRLYVAAGHGLYTDAGTTLATAPGDLIYRWKDYSGNNNHLEQASSGSRPAAGAAAQTVHNFDYFVGASGITTGVTDGELFGLIKLDNSPQTNGLPGLWGIGGGDLGVYASTDGNCYEGAGTTSRYSFTTPAGLTSWHVYSVRTSGTDWQALLNNTAVRSQSGNTSFWGGGSYAPTFGLSIASGLYLDGEFGALVFYDGARSSGERASIVAALLAQAPP